MSRRMARRLQEDREFIKKLRKEQERELRAIAKVAGFEVEVSPWSSRDRQVKFYTPDSSGRRTYEGVIEFGGSRLRAYLRVNFGSKRQGTFEVEDLPRRIIPSFVVQFAEALVGGESLRSLVRNSEERFGLTIRASRFRYGPRPRRRSEPMGWTGSVPPPYP